MTKKTVCLLLTALFLFFSGAFSASAADEARLSAESAGPSTPTRLSYISATYTAIRIVSGTATCTASVEGYRDRVTSVKIEMTLQKRVLLLFWSDEVTWSQTYPTYHGEMQKTASVSSGTYRTKAVYTAYAGSASETVTGESPSVTY